MLQTTTANMAITGVESTAPKIFWKGIELTEVIRFRVHVDDDGTEAKLFVQNTSNFDDVYAEIDSAGIAVKKVGN